MSFPEEWNFDRLTKDVILRPLSGEEETKSQVPKPGEDKKRKTASQSEDPKPKPQRVRRKVIALTMDSVQRLRDEEDEEEKNASALTARPRKVVEVTKPSEPTAAAKIKPHVGEASKKKSGEGLELPEVEIVSQPSTSTPDGAGSETPKIDQSISSDLLGTMTAGHLPSLPTFSEEALREARELKTPYMGGGSSVGDPFRDCFTGVDDASDISDASILLEEAQRLLSRCEIELQKVLEERNALKLLCGQKDETIKDLQADLAKAREEEAELDEQVQLRGVKQKSLAQAKRIEELETGLAKAKAEIEKTKVTADKSIAMYRAGAEATQMQLRDASNREQWIIDSAKCQSRRETLEEIHTRGFDLSEEIARAKVLEAEARQLASFDDEDDDEEGSRGGSDEGPEGEVAPEEEVETGRS
ncbi:autophagy-related protein 23-like [Nicotiana tomentosiformis]|uniref:autophagy-related protein 23-like n=1 Tax=Nicotiana tomentosiformis TaxID=4098 RepID=UPI00388CCD5A